MPTPLIRLSQIDKSFEGVQALQGVSFELHPAEVHALVGENGAGKSTLVKVITGAVWPDGGKIEIGEHSVTHLAPEQARQLGVACIYQHPALFPDLTVAENIGMRLERPAACHRIDWCRQRILAKELLDRVGATISVVATVGSLSMPNQQLVEIACALGANARVVIMDEPTASLTQREQHLLFRVVQDLRGQGAGIIYVSHRLDEIFALADRVTVLRDGRNVSTSAISKLTEHALIRLMVGRELSREQEHARTEQAKSLTPTAQLSPTSRVADHNMLILRNVSCAASGVRDINLELREGEILGLAGLVGAGRTELARILFGLTPADAGEIQVCGRPVVLNSPQTAVAHGIAYVPEDRARHGIIPELPVEQNITMAIHHQLFPGGWLRPRVERRVASDYIGALDVRPAAPAVRVASLSGGNQQKVSVARWLATKPGVLILDEPTQGVDVGAKNQLHELIRGLAQKGLAILLISSDLPELLALSDRIGVMRAGRLVSMLPGKTDPHRVMAAAFGQEVVL
jgi:rhamnose transport system ATP-binding protein